MEREKMKEKNKLLLEEKINTYIDFVKQINNGHVGGTLSLVHTFLYLYFVIVNKSKEQIIFSKGHASLGVYVMDVINKKVNIQDLVNNFERNGSKFGMIAKRDYSKEFICFGNLGNGISYATGKAIGQKDKRIFCFVGDGELNEGLCWEAFMTAYKYKLSNLYVIIDSNKFSHDGKTDDIMPQICISKKMTAFGFTTEECDGHSLDEIEMSFNMLLSDKKTNPKCLIINTIKAFGIKELENTVDSHSL